MSESPAQSSSKRFQRWGVGLGALAVLFVAVVSGLPFGIKYAFERALAAAGADEVLLEDVDFNPFSGNLVIRGLRAARGDAPPIRLPEVKIRLALMLLLHRQVYVEEAAIRDAAVAIDHPEGGRLEIGGLAIPARSEKQSTDGWSFGVHQLTVTGSRIDYSEPQSNGSLDIEELRLKALATWGRPTPPEFTFRGRLNGAPVAINSEVASSAIQAHTKAEIEVNELPLAPFSISSGSEATALGRLRLALRPVLALLAPEVTTVGGALSAQLVIDAGATSTGQTGVQGQISLRDLRAVARDGTELTQDRVAWDGSAQFAASAQRALGVRVEGALTVEGFRLKSPQRKLNITYEVLKWNGATVSNRSSARFLVENRGELSLEKLKLKTADTGVSEQYLAWDGVFKVEAPRTSRTFRYTADGELKIGKTVVEIAGTESWLAQHGGIEWTGQFQYAGAPDTAASEASSSPKLQWKGQFRMREFDLRDPGNRLGLVSVDDLELREINGDSEGFDISEARLTNFSLGIRLPEDAAPQGVPVRTLFSSAATTVHNISLKETRELSAVDVDIQDAVLLLRRRADGRFRLIEDVLGRLGVNKAGAVNKPKPQAVPMEDRTPLENSANARTVVRVARLSIGGDSRLRFEDESVKPAYKTDLALAEVSLKDMDSSDPAHSSPLSVIGTVGEYSKVELRGDIRPFAARLTLALAGKLEALDLQELSPYTSTHLGYGLKSGHMDADVDMRIDAGEMQGKSRLVLHNLDVAPGDPKKLERLKKQVSVPLDSAIAMLSDKERNIRLEIPISGDITDPKFDLSDAINQAVGKAMKAAAVTFLKVSFQPFGTMITVVELAGKAAGAIQLDPVAFAPGSANLDDVARQYLQRLSAVMEERPDLRIRLCGKGVQSDRDALRGEAEAKLKTDKHTGKKIPSGQSDAAAISESADEQILALAKQRSQAIKDTLVKVQGIPAERLFLCQSEIELEPEGKPRVDVLI